MLQSRAVGEETRGSRAGTHPRRARRAFIRSADKKIPPARAAGGPSSAGGTGSRGVRGTAVQRPRRRGELPPAPNVRRGYLFTASAEFLSLLSDFPALFLTGFCAGSSVFDV